MRFLGAGLALILAAMATHSVAAERSAIFDVNLRGVSLGRLHVLANESGANYASSVTIKGGGVLSLLVDFSFRGTGQGRMNENGIPSASRYDGTRVLRDDARRTKMSFKGGRVTARSRDPEKRARDYDVALSALPRVVDPVSATYALLMDQPVGNACGRSLDVFDGSRHFRVSVGGRQAAAKGRWTCSGVYQRVAGYSPKKMAEKTRFPFTLIYEEVDGMMRVLEFRADTIAGDAVAWRR